ncbi:PH domain-containing protein [Crossiella sp. SN42]|uniref:PH domain-containing protein n=1 Tax=Crossiella sp. SN42 TaxID=2944808 RepID=UPI00207CFF52|nr:PH domain-containing protein [Crossiella sp. SN42]MCO1577727.1 PH domain-containing protein [Crossiella sp. SN42]
MTTPTAAAPRLRPPRYRVDPRARRWWTVQALLTVSGPAFLVALTMTTLSLLFFPGALRWLGPLLLGVLVLPGLAYLLIMPPWRYRVHAWELGSTAVYSASGWFWQRRRITPLTKVQTVDTVIGPIQRGFGLATVIVTTASTAGDVRISGLGLDDATELARRIGEAAAVEEA